ncbi:MAG: DUF4345 family protein [Anaerolineales bacterium]|nr:MAG: DUF4345 family protein [Anaerolineales bacterium]
MNILQILQYSGCILTALVGAYAMVAPKNTVGFTGLAPQGGRGITEIRVVFGMFFIVLGLFPILAGSAVAFQMLGYAYLFVGIARSISIFADKSGTQSNWYSVIFEIVFGVILIL